MPLSEHEQRLLEQIEQALYAEDPKFAAFYRTTDLRKHYRRRIWRWIALAVVGLGLLVAGVVVPLIPLGVAGFVVMLAGFTLAITTWQRTLSRAQRVAAPERPRAARSPRSLLGRLEDRWQRRMDGDSK